MEEQKIIDAVTTAFDAREKQKSAFRVDPERHFKHHDFIDEIITFFAYTRKIIWKTVLVASVMGVISIFGLGVATFFYLKSRGFV